jgi:hypothetical protein
VRYKERLVAQGFTQSRGVDFNKTYSPVMSRITFRYFISFAVQNRLSMQLMDVVTTYLYGSLDSNIYMKVLDGIHVPDNKANRNMYCIKLLKSLYGLKQSSRMWYNWLSEFLKSKGYTIMMIVLASSLKGPQQDFVSYRYMSMILISLATRLILMKLVII